MRFIVDEQIEDERIDSYLAEIMPEISRSKIQKAIKQGSCIVNNKPVKNSYILKINDIVDVTIRQEVVTSTIQAEDISLDVIWENENMAVINKPSGMLTHPTSLETSGTLVNALLFKYCENLSDLNGDFRKGIVHRLDRNTSGLIMIAKNNKTHEFLVQEMKEKNFCKKYIAIVRGIIENDSFKIDTPIGRHPSQPHKMVVNGKDAKESLTLVKVKEYLKDATVVELTLITGRTHQIRVHMASIGHPVYNDTLYGFGKTKIKTEEQVLQSYHLEFTKPFTKERLVLEIPNDEKFLKVYNALKN